MTAVVSPQIALDVGTPGTLAVHGELSFDTAAGALQSIQAALADGAVRQLNLAGVTRSDSAGLACILAVAADASRQGRALEVANMPVGMRTLAQVCEIDQLIG